MSEQIIGAILDSLGWSAAAREHQRANAENMFASAAQGLQQGIPLKEQGVDARFIEQTMGPDYAAYLAGYEKGEAFKTANQSYQTRRGIAEAASAFLGQREFTVPQGQAAGPMPDEGIAPSSAEYGRRLDTLTPETQALIFGPQVANIGLQADQLSKVAVPGVQTDRDTLEKVGIPGAAATTQNAATNAGLAAFQTGPEFKLRQQAQDESIRQFNSEQSRMRAVKVREQKVADRTSLLQAQRDVDATMPTLTSVQRRKVAKYRAGMATEQSLGSLADKPGVVIQRNGRGNMIPASAYYKRVNEVSDGMRSFLNDPKQREAINKWEEIDYDNYNNGNITAWVKAILDYNINVKGDASIDEIMKDVLREVRILTPEGVTSLDALDPALRSAKLTQIRDSLESFAGGLEAGAPGGAPLGTAPAGAAASYNDRVFSGAAAGGAQLPPNAGPQLPARPATPGGKNVGGRLGKAVPSSVPQRTVAGQRGPQPLGPLRQSPGRQR